jgi:hypothetical protein
MNISVYRIKYSIDSYTYFKYDNPDLLPLLTKEAFIDNYNNICKNIYIEKFQFNDSIELYNILKSYGIYLKIGDIIIHNDETYYYSNPLVKFDILL